MQYHWNDNRFRFDIDVPKQTAETKCKANRYRIYVDKTKYQGGNDNTFLRAPFEHEAS